MKKSIFFPVFFVPLVIGSIIMVLLLDIGPGDSLMAKMDQPHLNDFLSAWTA